MKIVDKVSLLFSKRFSGAAHEDWVRHLDDLERDLAEKHNWDCRQFYYALRETLNSKAKRSLMMLERGLEKPELHQYIPKWYEPSSEEWRGIHSKLSFADLSFRTRIAVLIAYFHHRFQATTPHAVWDTFTHAVQGVSESVEDWGLRLEEYIHRCRKFGLNVTFNQFLYQWLTGTTNATFLKKLRKAVYPKQPGADPEIYDLPSFTAWYQNYKNFMLREKRDSEERSRLLSQSRLFRKRPSRGDPARKSSAADNSPGAAGKKLSQPQPKTQPPGLSRPGPANIRNRNPHSGLFEKRNLPSQPSSTRLKSNSVPRTKRALHIRCFNCNKLGHYAKDCPHERQPRRPLGQTLQGFASMLGELEGSLGPDDKGHLDRFVSMEYALTNAAASLINSMVEGEPTVSVPEANSKVSERQALEKAVDEDGKDAEADVSDDAQSSPRDHHSGLGLFSAVGASSLLTMGAQLGHLRRDGLYEPSLSWAQAFDHDWHIVISDFSPPFLPCSRS